MSVEKNLYSRIKIYFCFDREKKSKFYENILLDEFNSQISGNERDTFICTFYAGSLPKDNISRIQG